EAYQDDFAAGNNGHSASDEPKLEYEQIIVVDSTDGLGPSSSSAAVDSRLIFDAWETFVPDGDSLSFRWSQWIEPSTKHSTIEENVVQWGFNTESGKQSCVSLVSLSLVSDREGRAVVSDKDGSQTLHLTLQVADPETPPLTSYTAIQVCI
ncbi:uncharacterized protein BO66DRAFT_334596, partial [Aspergillus aculeatinus CBS 121060]